MNRHGGLHDLDNPNDEEVQILHEICRIASASTDPPFAALFASYDVVFAAQGLDTARDPSIFRWLMRIADSVRPERRNGPPHDFVRQLRSLLEDRGIEIVDHGQDDDVDEEGTAKSVDAVDAPSLRYADPVRRRVSFDDARLEETWLSEHSKPINPIPQPPPDQSTSRFSHRGRDVPVAQIRRRRSDSNTRSNLIQQLAPRPAPRNPPAEAPTSDHDTTYNPTLLFEPSQTELELNAEAFYETSELRLARQCLHTWHDLTLRTQGRRLEAIEVAVSRDQRTLLKQSLDIWYTAYRQRRAEQERDGQLEIALQDYTRRKNSWLLAKAFSHWDESARHQKRATAVAQRYAMKVKYFNRWRRIAIENTTKVRSLHTRKCLNLWRDRVADQAVVEQRALAHHEESLMKNCFQRLFWTFCSRRVSGWHDQHVERRSFKNWRARLGQIDARSRQAEDFRNQCLTSHAFQKLLVSLRRQQRSAEDAKTCYDRRLTLDCLQSMLSAVRLAPLATTTSNRVDLDLMRKTIKVWRIRLSSSREATAVDRKRVLQTAWTSWNDALRCKALTQRIDERILVENLYKWVLRERLRSFQKNLQLQTARKSLDKWHDSCRKHRSALAGALATFKEQERQRRMRSGMHCLYSALRARENSDRTALEFSNTRALPLVLHKWRQQTQQIQQLTRWANDARFYCLASQTLKTWSIKTSEHKHNRRREAYAQIRSKIKFKAVKECFARWREKTTVLLSLHEQAEQRQRARLVEIGISGFDTWRGKAALSVQLDEQATAIDQSKLLISALSTLTSLYDDLTILDERALSFRHETTLSQASTALKRLQWQAFTLTRRAETADALRLRTRDQHLRHMLRHLATEAQRRRSAATTTTSTLPDPESSPSLRPASRLAATATGSASRTSAGHQPPPSRPNPPGTPAYMQTPTTARSRRAARFRPLPTPAPLTPMLFDPAAYEARTPGFSAFASRGEGRRGERGDEERLGVGRPGREGEGGVERGVGGEGAEEESGDLGLSTSRITPFARKLRAGGFTPAVPPPSALRRSVFGLAEQGRSVGGTNKSVRFARSSRFGGSREG